MAQNNNKKGKLPHQVETTICILEAETPWANHAELYIGLFKEAVYRDLSIMDSPMVLWYYCM